MINQMVCERYHIQQKLSDKAGRQTYLAHDQQQDQQVILKLLNFDATMTWDHFKLFEREAKTLQTLSHPAIPKYKDYLDLESEGYQGFALVQTYISGQSLESYLQAGRTFSEAELKQLAQSLLEILSYLHDHHPPVIHRDIKPSNILLGDRSGNHLGQVYLVDFGSVQTVASKESGTITIVGSYGYIPYEQFCGQAAPASDLYSLGMTLLYLATGLHPADQPQKQGEVQIKNIGLSRAFEQWLKKMTCSGLDRRFSDAHSALKALLDGEIETISTLKPERTNVQLHRTDETLEVSIPKHFQVIQMILGSFLKFLPLLVLFGLAAPNLVKTLGFLVIFKVIFVIPVIVIGYRVRQLGSPERKFFTCLGLLFTTQFNRPLRTIKWMMIDDHTITIQTYFTKEQLFRSRINRLCYACSYEFDHFWDSSGEKINRGKVTVEPKIMMYIDGLEYVIEGLTNAEYWWLGQELSDFLGLELQLIYPTPQVPPEPS